MADLKFDINAEEIATTINGISTQVKKDVEDAVGSLANITYNKVDELARQNLSSLQRMYLENLTYESPEKGLHVVSLAEPALWIEEGRKAGFMEELLKIERPGSVGKIKDGKNGKYRVIPFEHSKNPTDQSPKAQALANQIKQVMEEKGLHWQKIEKDESGSPRVGLLHRFNVESARLSPLHKTDPLKSVAVYQKKNKQGTVEKHVMTFRVISEKHRGEGLWDHPGRTGDKLMDKAFDWAMTEWETNILPAIFEKYK